MSSQAWCHGVSSRLITYLDSYLICANFEHQGKSPLWIFRVYQRIQREAWLELFPVKVE